MSKVYFLPVFGKLGNYGPFQIWDLSIPSEQAPSKLSENRWICTIGTTVKYIPTFLYYLQSPFGGDDEEELFDSICNSKIPYSRFLDNHTIDYLDKLLQRDPTVRLGCIEDQQPIRKHPFFRSIDFSRLEKREIAPPYKPTVVSGLVTIDAAFIPTSAAYVSWSVGKYIC